jgi:arylsulfatase A-like enzyme
VLRTVPFLAGLKALKNKSEAPRQARCLNVYESVMEDAKRAVVDPSLGPTLLHFPIPHPPIIYNRRSGDFRVDRACNYLDNLALVDRAFGELRREMESAGTWETTTIIVSSDHPLREKKWGNGNGWPQEDFAAITARTDPRVPFIVKLAGHTQAISYDSPFNTVLTHDLLLAILGGEVSSPQNVIEWLEKNRTLAESPYRKKRKDNDKAID